LHLCPFFIPNLLFTRQVQQALFFMSIQNSAESQ
jgi:hypothetical protein